MSRLWPGRYGSAIDYISSAPSDDFCKKSPRAVAILGSTGSIGRNALAVIDKNPQFFSVVGLGAGRNMELLARQAIRYRPDILAVLDENLASKLKSLLPDDYNPQIVSGDSGYARLACCEQADCIVSAQVGFAGLVGTLSAALAGKIICLANKESLVVAGALVRKICRQTGAAILPVDSEHYAIFQCLAGRDQEISRLILTASGGPFRGRKAAEIYHMLAKDALKHPNWSMGAKITIDSATMMNKGFEALEAMHLYGVEPEKVSVLVHPQSIVHSLVQFADNSFLAQLASPDMRLPISACMCWPYCRSTATDLLDLTACSGLTFYQPDNETFPCMQLAISSASCKITGKWAETGLNPACIVLNAANEAAVQLFLAGRCHFGQIYEFVRQAMQDLPAGGDIHLEMNMTSPSWRTAVCLVREIEKLDRETRRQVYQFAGQAAI